MIKRLEKLELKDFDLCPLWVDLYGNNDLLEGFVKSLDGMSHLSTKYLQ